MRRREFLRTAAAVAGGLALGGTTSFDAGAVPLVRSARQRMHQGSLLDHAAADAPIDTVVVLMMENRSFDHYLGWLGADEEYLDAGRRRYGSTFGVDGNTDQSYVDIEGRRVRTHHLTRSTAEPHPYRGCGHPVPGHGWFAGRIELAEGFLAPGTGNDEYALGWFDGNDLPIHAHLAKRFTVLDHSFASLMGPTFPNRQYLYAAQSGAWRDDPGPLNAGIFDTPTIFDKLLAGGVPFRTYHTDVPMLLLWGEQYADYIRPLDDFFADAEAGTLPNVVFLTPGFQGALRSDDHAQGDVRVGQAFIREVFQAFAESAHWDRGLFVLTYDEWGGFFDHVEPPRLADNRASRNLERSFGLAGFRVPTILASPYARPGAVDHQVYDHTSILRFLEWRFLGAPARGPGKATDTWHLTLRDRYANNPGESLAASHPDPALGFDLASVVVPYDPGCEGTPQPLAVDTRTGAAADPFRVAEELSDLLARHYPPARHTPWLT